MSALCSSSARARGSARPAQSASSAAAYDPPRSAQWLGLRASRPAGTGFPAVCRRATRPGPAPAHRRRPPAACCAAPPQAPITCSRVEPQRRLRGGQGLAGASAAQPAGPVRDSPAPRPPPPPTCAGSPPPAPPATHRRRHRRPGWLPRRPAASLPPRPARSPSPAGLTSLTSIASTAAATKLVRAAGSRGPGPAGHRRLLHSGYPLTAPLARSPDRPPASADASRWRRASYPDLSWLLQRSRMTGVPACWLMWIALPAPAARRWPWP